MQHAEIAASLQALAAKKAAQHKVNGQDAVNAFMVGWLSGALAQMMDATAETRSRVASELREEAAEFGIDL